MKLLDDSLQKIALKWKSMGRSFTANVFEGMTMTCTYFDKQNNSILVEKVPTL